MPNWLLSIPLENGGLIAAMLAVTSALVAGLVAHAVRGGMLSRLHRIGLLAAGAGLGAAFATALTWWMVDVQNVFGAPASLTTRSAAVVTGAGLGSVVVMAVVSTWRHRALAVLTAGLVLVSGGLIINLDVGYYPSVADLVGAGAARLRGPVRTSGMRSIASWAPPSTMPAQGVVRSAHIPASRSAFTARDALVYLPPAALVAAPPRLPVVIAFAGQPGRPADVFGAGGLASTLDSIASAHRGLAPIVVVPDPLGPAERNTFCVDGPLGRVSTYVTVDVRTWIERNLPVLKSPDGWTVAGFSQGATCAVQFGAANPDVFAALIAVAPQQGPFTGSVAETIRVGFHGSADAYHEALPTTVMRARAPYRHLRALFAVGQLDTRYGPQTSALASAATAAGIRTATLRIPGAGHNWHTASAGLSWGLGRLLATWGIR